MATFNAFLILTSYLQFYYKRLSQLLAIVSLQPKQHLLKKVAFYDTMKHLVKKYLLIVNIKPHSLILILASTILLTGVAQTYKHFWRLTKPLEELQKIIESEINVKVFYCENSGLIFDCIYQGGIQYHQLQLHATFNAIYHYPGILIRHLQ